MAGRLDERYGRVIMAKDKETYDSYAKDVFDNPPAGPVGVHRGARSAGARMTPFLIVLLVVALAASAHGVCCRECSPTCSSGTTARRRRLTTRRPTATTRRPATRRSPARASSPLLVRLTVPPTRLPIPPRIPPRAIRHRAAATVRPMPPTRTGRGRTPPPRPTRSRRRRPPPRRTRPLPSA